jgi:drug/metabolite transporter (DMT)-like permease
MMNNKSWFLLLLLSFIWGGSFYFIGEGVRYVPPLTLVWYRILFAGIALYILLLWRRQKLPTQFDFWFRISIMVLLNNIIPFTLIAWGQQTISGGLAAIFIPSEPLDARRVIGTLIGIIGVVLVIGMDALTEITLASLSQLAILLATISYALGSVWGKTRLSSYKPLDIACGTLLVGSVIVAPIMVFADGIPDLAAFEWKFITILIGLSIAGTAFAYVIYYRILELAGASSLMLVTIIVPIFAVSIDAIILSKWISAQTLGGFVIISLGLSLIDGRIWWLIAKRLKAR